jgi:hypothetical protein
VFVVPNIRVQAKAGGRSPLVTVPCNAGLGCVPRTITYNVFKIRNSVRQSSMRKDGATSEQGLESVSIQVRHVFSLRMLAGIKLDYRACRDVTSERNA